MREAANFLWGASTAAHQVEGGNRWNDWWALEESGRLPHRSGEACRHYDLYESDFDLARSLGHNAHRLSLEWSRIEPADGEWNEAALAHYADVMAALRARGLEPLVTLQHFTLPAWLARRGGWLAPDALERFARYVDVAARALAGQVRHWITDQRAHGLREARLCQLRLAALRPPELAQRRPRRTQARARACARV